MVCLFIFSTQFLLCCLSFLIDLLCCCLQCRIQCVFPVICIVNVFSKNECHLFTFLWYILIQNFIVFMKLNLSVSVVSYLTNNSQNYKDVFYSSFQCFKVFFFKYLIFCVGCYIQIHFTLSHCIIDNYLSIVIDTFAYRSVILFLCEFFTFITL